MIERGDDVMAPAPRPVAPDNASARFTAPVRAWMAPLGAVTRADLGGRR